MATSNHRASALVWVHPAQMRTIAQACEIAGVEIVALGVPAALGRSGFEVPESLSEAQQHNDLPRALSGADPDLVILGTTSRPDPASGSDPLLPYDDDALLNHLESTSARIVSLLPVPGTSANFSVIPTRRHPKLPMVLPLFCEGDAARTAADLLETFGSVRTLGISFRCGSGHGGLGARLFDAMHAVHAFIGQPDQVDASVVTHVASSGVRRAPPETLGLLEGDLTANLRYAGGCAASLALSDRAGRWFRGATILGERGCIRLDESGFEHFDESGETVDSSRDADASEREVDGAARALGRELKRLLDPQAAKHTPFDSAAVLASCEAALLSARTGQPESPATLQRVARAG